MYLYTRNIKTLQSSTVRANKYKKGEHAYIITRKLNKSINVYVVNGTKPYGVYIFNMYNSDKNIKIKLLRTSFYV